ncbi:hypothetical protein D1007_36062 [Hordeum vulgare]|nr:hypothetical protein D1007_36062 [Hordeum vulgare]
MFQSLGIGAIPSIIRKTNDVQEGRTNEVKEGSGVINDDPEYNPKEDEVIYGEEVDDVVVHQTIKKSRTKRHGVKKTVGKKGKSSETCVAMPPRRVMAPPLGQTKRILEPALDRVTRKKEKMAAAKDHQQSPLCVDFESMAQMGDEFPQMDEETTLIMKERGTVCLDLSLVVVSIDRNVVISEEEQQLVLQSGKFTFAMISFSSAFFKWNVDSLQEAIYRFFLTSRNTTNASLLEDYIGKVLENFEMNTDSKTINTACKDILQKNSKKRHHQIKKKYFDTVEANKVSIKSPVPDLTDGEWQALVDMWSTQRHKETYVSNKMNREKVVYQQRTGSRHYTTHIFPLNVGLQSSSYNSGKATTDVAAHARDLEQKLERSELQAEVMQEEMAAIKMKAEESEAACDKELEVLRKKSQEQDEKLSHLIALFGAKAS